MKLTSLVTLSCKTNTEVAFSVLLTPGSRQSKQMTDTNLPSGPGRLVLLAALCVHGGCDGAYKVGTATSGSYGSTTAVFPAHALCTLGPRGPQRIMAQ